MERQRFEPRLHMPRVASGVRCEEMAGHRHGTLIIAGSSQTLMKVSSGIIRKYLAVSGVWSFHAPPPSRVCEHPCVPGAILFAVFCAEFVTDSVHLGAARC